MAAYSVKLNELMAGVCGRDTPLGVVESDMVDNYVKWRVSGRFGYIGNRKPDFKILYRWIIVTVVDL